LFCCSTKNVRDADMQPLTTSFGHGLTKDEQQVLSMLQEGISQAADAILLKDHEVRRRVLTARANSAYKMALQLMILESPTMSSAQVQRNLAHLEALLRRLGEAVTRRGPAKLRFVSSKDQHCAVCLGTESEKR
jgi:hypothetical protein